MKKREEREVGLNQISLYSRPLEYKIRNRAGWISVSSFHCLLVGVKMFSTSHFVTSHFSHFIFFLLRKRTHCKTNTKTFLILWMALLNCCWIILDQFGSLETSPNFPQQHVSFAHKIGSGSSPIQTFFQPARTPTDQSQKRISALIGCQFAVLSSATHRAHETQITL